MISLQNVAKAYGGQVLLRDVSWRIGRGERIGLVGPNGAGKTTLCRMLAGVEDLDAGQVHLDTGVTVGYLPQEVRVGGDLTVLAEALSGYDSVWRLEAQLEELAARMAGPDADPSLTETLWRGATSLRGPGRLSVGVRGEDHPWRVGIQARRASSPAAGVLGWLADARRAGPPAPVAARFVAAR